MTARYRVRDWGVHFENSRSRDYKQLNWVPIPNKHDGKGYRRLIALENGPAVFAAWVLIVQVASKCPQRGVLADEDGPLDAVDLSHKTGCPAEVFAQAFDVLCLPKIGWLEVEQLAADDPQSVSTLTESVSVLTASVSVVPLNRTEENRTEEKRNKEKTSPKLRFSDDDRGLAQEMFSLIQELIPNSKEPDLDKWANEFRLMRERDGTDRTVDGIRDLMRWALGHSFWKSNVLSPDALRKQWDRLTIQRKEQHDPQRTNTSKPDGRYRETGQPGGRTF